MSMMEAAERHARDKPQRDTTVRAAASSGEDDECNDNDSQGDNTNGSMNALDDEEVYDLNRIIGGMATLSGPCGTYAVKDSGGLLVRTALNDDDDENNHHFNENNNNKDGSTDEDAENRSSLLQQPFPISISASEDSIEVKKPSSLERGQTVQVVRFENGVATLARNAGFITATSSQLVKSKCNLFGLLV